MSKYVATTAERFDAIAMRLASPEEIQKWSRGEVKKPETINYRTFKPEKDGLFCERIFGPVKDWECGCGKYKKVKHRGITCDRCGVEITEAKVRRERMGSIQLAVPVTHIWFFKTTPSCIGNLLDLSIRVLERIIYFENYIVVDPGDTSLEKMTTLTEDEYQDAREDWGDRFVARMGAEAIKMLLEEIDVETLSAELHQQLSTATSKQARTKAIKRLKVVEALRKSGNNPAWMVLDIVPVIPPDLRPLVPLEGGRYATSDLNDLYRRVINRNNRLKRLMELRAPEVILRNEKRMLQEAVDALFDNGRHGRTVLGAGNRPLKSLSDMLKGKQGRFRQNLLGKRVDYSGRSVIVVGPELKLHQCGLPKKMALELFEPFIIRELKDRGSATTIKAAKRAIAQGQTEVWDILEEVIQDHPVLLNRAPTLHRLGIQAFEPVLIEGKAIQIHPLVCAAFNADFDGDQMAVHVPLMPAAQLEARLLMMASTNIFAPSNGEPIITPGQDIVLGLSYITKQRMGAKGEWRDEWTGPNGEILEPGRVYPDTASVLLALEMGEVDLHAGIKVWCDGEVVDTTVGRVVLKEGLGEDVPLSEVNAYLNKSRVGELLARAYARLGHTRTVQLSDALKYMGFRYSTLSGISIAVSDMPVPEEKPKLIEHALEEVARIDEMYQNGLITQGERYNKVIDQWTATTEDVSASMLKALAERNQGFTGVYLMMDSGARGSKQQVRQLAAMRGLMAKPSGDIIESPITSNFREGLTVLEYFISAHGARKGLADTALKTADAGYLTRRLVDVAQDVTIEEEDCGALSGVYVEALTDGPEIVEALEERLIGRYALEDIMDPARNEPIVRADEEIDETKAARLAELGLPGVTIRSALTCQSKRGVCAKCYGRNMATGKLVELGEAVGIIAAQAIGEPGTQLTMRTFHIGGAASRQVEASDIKMPETATVRYHGVKTAISRHDKRVVVNRAGEVSLHDAEDREVQRFALPTGSVLIAEDGQKLRKGQLLYQWDPYNNTIVAEASGRIHLEGMVEGVTMRVEINPETGMEERVITEHKQDLHPQITILGDNDEVLAYATIPGQTHVMVAEGQEVQAGDLLAKTPRQFSKTKDITGGLPRVAELFEARTPKDPAIISHIDGMVELGGSSKGMKKLKVVPPMGKEREYTIPPGKHLNVQAGDRVYAGQRLTDGPVILQDMLEVQGEEALRKYLLDEIQQVYRVQGVRTNDKHIETIIRQMLRKVRVKDDPGDTPLLAQEEVDKIRFREVNEQTLAKGGRPAEAAPILQGITKAALSTDSFVAAASFQQTTRVLTEAALSGKRDYLTGLKENVIIGHLIPAGTGSSHYQDTHPVVTEDAAQDFSEELAIGDESEKLIESTDNGEEETGGAIA